MDTNSVKDAVAEAIAETGFTPEEGSPVSDLTLDDKEATPEVIELEKPFEAAVEEKPRGEDGKFVSREKTEEEAEPPEPKKVVKESVSDEEDLSLSSEELDEIRNSPLLSKVYKGMVRGYTTKTSDLKTKFKDAEQAVQTLQAIRAKPMESLETMAAALGKRIVDIKEAPAASPKEPKAVEPPKSRLDRVVGRLTQKLGKEAAEVLGPEFVEIVQDIIKEENDPIKQRLTEREQREAESSQREAQHALRTQIMSFGNTVLAEGGEWDEEVEADMAKLVGKVIPGPDVPLQEFLGVLYNQVQTTRNKNASKQREVTRLRESVRHSEPLKPVKTTTPTAPEIKPGMNAKQATVLAVQMAKREMSGR